MKIETERAFSAILLPAHEARLAPVDRGLCHELVLGALRRQMPLDRTIDALTGGKKLDAAVRVILRLGAYQLLFLDKVPAHAAINDAVELTRRAKKTSAKGFVNAVLRRLTRERVATAYADEIERVAVETSHPRWLLEKWTREFGAEDAARLARANNETPAADFRFTAKTTDAARQAAARLRDANDAAGLRGMAERGEIYFQDRASQMVAEAVRLKNGEALLDVCAAPGSKTTFIAARVAAAAPRNLLVAGDLHRARVETLRDNCRRQGAGFVAVVRYDAENALPFADESFDAVLLDAPCSGTGTIRHNPEIRYFLDEKDFAALQSKQLRLIENASKLVKRGGRLIYSTCSLEREENETVCARFLAADSHFALTAPPVAPQLLTADGFARTFPPRDDADGFFLAVFEKK